MKKPELLQTFFSFFQYLAKLIEVSHAVSSIQANILKQDCQKLSFYLKLLQLQLSDLIQFITATTDDELKERVIKIQEREKVELKFINSLQQINLKMFNQTLILLQNDLMIETQNFLDELQYLIKEDASKKKDRKYGQINMLISKFEILLQLLPFALIVDKNDIFCFDKNSTLWEILKQFIQNKQLSPTQQIIKSYSKIEAHIRVASASLSHSKKVENKLENSIQKIQTNYWFLKYYSQPTAAQNQSDIFVSHPDPEAAITLWNMLDYGMGKPFAKLNFQLIRYHKKIYIDPVTESLTQKSILEQYKNNTIQNIEKKSPIIYLKMNQSEDVYYKELKKQQKDKISIRILCSQKLHRPSHEFREPIDFYNEQYQQNSQKVNEQEQTKLGKGIFQKFTKLFGKSQAQEMFHEKIIIQIHGGGFVAMSSSSHQVYTRKWANDLGVPVFCIDYKKAPQYPYPYGLDDCWQAYNWIINFVGRYFNVIPKQVILAGDSAGGNLALGLTYLCIKYNVKKPTGLLLIYPALNLNMQRFTPSLLVSLNDTMLPHTFLKICQDSYIPQKDELNPQIDPFISPIYANDKFISELPPIRLLQGTKDPFHDDSCRLVSRCIKYNKNVKMIAYNDMPHGFMQLGGKIGMPEANQCVEDSVIFLKELLNNQ